MATTKRRRGLLEIMREPSVPRRSLSRPQVGEVAPGPSAPNLLDRPTLLTTLRKIRTEAKISQRSAAEALGVSQVTIWRIEQGEHKNLLEKYASFLGWEIQERFILSKASLGLNPGSSIEYDEGDEVQE